MVRSAGIALVLCLLFSASLAHAGSVVFLSFTGLQDQQLVGDFYNSQYGVSFSSNFYGLRPVSNGGSGNFAPDPTGSAAIFMSGSGPNVMGYMNVANGFSSGINFLYTAAFQEQVQVWSGMNGTGTLLATITLSPNDGGCTGAAYCNWSDVGLSFSGTAESVTFTGTGNGIGFSDITLGRSTTVLPEPSSQLLFGTGLVGLCGWKIGRFRSA